MLGVGGNYGLGRKDGFWWGGKFVMLTRVIEHCFIR